MDDFTLGLALYDYLPGILSGVGLFFLAMITRQKAPTFTKYAYAGVALVTLAGLLKATWKLTVVLTGQDVVWLAESMFPLMAPGFVLMTVTTWAAVRASNGKAVPRWPIFAALGVIAAAAGGIMAVGTLEGLHDISMQLASVANLTLTVMLVLAIIREGQWYIAPLFVINIAMIFALVAIAQMATMSVAIHWLEQSLTVFGAAAFAVGTYTLMRRLLPTPTLQTAVG